ncbi:sulfite exporter TauE/SafE family protein [Roseovarius aestuariivivens]|uniref:sulfite exporter TauE/SafE family protein n=1 Tax=Roseovarius aestuariivivens TaxID=1888910 RepID=UPI001FD87728|nr:sulfite exporter TauE/SafE family protein [Roseovarius aestuariivivens]
MLPDFQTTQIAFLAGACFLAALVRGFSGFGSGLVYLPLAAQVLTPFQALTTIVIFDLFGPIPILRRAARSCEARDLVRLLTGLVVALPLGLFALTLVPAEVFRYAVSAVALTLLVCLVSGLRYHGALTPPLVYTTGGLSGFLQGVAGLPGPPVILLYMASTRPVQVVRANTLLFLFATDVVLLPMLALFGRLDPSALVLGAALVVPNLLGGLLGARLFRPEYERVYRTIAYTIIAASALSGLPFWDG